MGISSKTTPARAALTDRLMGRGGNITAEMNRDHHFCGFTAMVAALQFKPQVPNQRPQHFAVRTLQPVTLEAKNHRLSGKSCLHGLT